MIGHRIGPEAGLVVFDVEIPQIHGVVGVPELLFDLEVLKGDLVLGDIDLDIPARLVIEVHSLGELDHKLLDKGRDVLVGKHGSLEFLNLHDLVGDLDLEVVLDFDLAAQSKAFLGFLLADVAGFGGEEAAAAFLDLALAHGAGAASAAG